MANQIINAAPMVIDRGTQDLSTRQVPREQESIPQHLPKFYLFTQKGPVEPQLVVGAERDKVFGSKSFDLRSKYANHSTVFANLANAEGNSCMIQRLIPADAGPEATIVAWLDVLPTTVDLYQRNTDGSIALDANGDPIITGTTSGYKIKWVVTNYTTTTDIQNFGGLTQTTGDQTDVATGVQSTRYPIFELKASSVGEDGNLAGIRLNAITTANTTTLPTKLMSDELAYPFEISVIKKPDINSSPNIVETLFGETSVTVTFKPGTLDPLTDAEMFIGDVFINKYQNISDPRYAKVYGEFGDIHVYTDNIDQLLTDFHASEVPYIDAFSDITADVNSKYLLNFISGVSSSNVRYHSIVFVDAPNSVRFSEYTNVYAAGSSDGTLNDVVHAQLVENELARYLDPNDELQDIAVNVESIIYDTGFPLSTKFALCQFVGLRKDTFVVLGTHDVNDRVLTASEEHSLAVALRTRLQSYPESDYFGTPVMRGMIVGRSGKLRNSQFSKDLPLTAEVLIKAARYMGASNGRWKNGSHFDGAPGSVVENMYDINITWVPTSIRNKNWDVGLNWVQSYDRRSYFFPALKTIYPNDTSVLNSFITAMAIAHLNKIAHSVWREFSGVSHLTNAQLVSRVNDFIANRSNGIFDGRFVIEPDTYFTDLDLLRGYSWTTAIKIYAANMKTVMTTLVQAYRISDLNQ